MTESRAAGNTWIQRSAKTTTVYLPGTHPAFENHVKHMMKSIGFDIPDEIENLRWRAMLLLLASEIRTLRIMIDMDTRITIDKLESMCVEKNAEEASAFATYEIATGEDKIIALDVYNFVKQLRVDLENEIQRCSRNDKNKIEPTPHVTISESSRNILRIILPCNTLYRKFMSVGALSKVVNNGIMQFLTCPDREIDRVVLVKEILKSNT